MLAFVVAFALAAVAYQAFYHHERALVDPPAELREKQELRIWHYLAIGSLRGLAPFPECDMGEFCGPELAYERANFPTFRARETFDRELMKASYFTDFPFGYLNFAVKKITFAFSDGQFGAWYDGRGANDGIVWFHNGALAQKIRHVFGPTTLAGATFQKAIFLKNALTILFQVMALTVLFTGAREIFSAAKSLVNSGRARLDWLGATFFATFVGVALYDQIFEGRARYLFLYAPFFILYFVRVLAISRGKADRPQQRAAKL